MDLHEKCVRLVERLGLGSASDIVSIESLSGGVSCDIATVDLSGSKICAKFALPKLRVAADWYAPPRRNKAEYNWLEFVREIVPGATPELYGRDEALCGFAMEFIPAHKAYLWKTALLERAPCRAEARMAGETLGRIHAASRQPGFDAGNFNNQSDFHDLRIEPYLKFTASRHPALAREFDQIIGMLGTRSEVLIHGDVSPKNIFFRDGDCLILDAECATMGDASFDLAFLINHLLLKAFHMPDRKAALLAEAHSFWAAYRPHIKWEAADALEEKTCRLLPALMLARVDGKSPVEYLDEATRARTRVAATSLLKDAPKRLRAFLDQVSQEAVPAARST